MKRSLPYRQALSERAEMPGSSARGVRQWDRMAAILVAAAWFGLVVGLTEGMGLWVLRQLGWLGGPFVFLGSSLEIVWISTLFDLLLFLMLGMVLSLVVFLLPQLPIVRGAVFLFTCMAFFDWLAIPLVGRARIWAVAVLALGLAVQSVRWFGRHQEAAMRFWRKSLPWLGAVSLLLLLVIQGGFWLQEQIALARLPKAALGAPNILVIVIDTLRADHLLSYGYERSTSPNLDQLAQQGVLFENSFSTSPWTKPSHASLVTGRYTYEHGADAAEKLDDRYVTIGEALQDRGYRTAAFSGNYETFSQIDGFGRGFHRFEDYFRSYANMAIHTLYGRTIEYYALHAALGLDYRLDRKLASDINEATLRWIEREPQRPFFALLNYYDVHAPYIPPQPYRSRFSQLEEPGGLINTDWDQDHIYVPMTPEQLQGEMDAYDGAIAYVDEHIGQLLDGLVGHGLTQDTLVVITSDHGEMFGEHGLLEHNNSLYREVIHVPLIFWWPGHVPAGKRVQRPISNVALPATLLDLIGEEGQMQFPGPSLAQLWEEPELDRDWPDPLAEVAQIFWVPDQHLPAHGAMRSVLTPRWHYIVHDEFGEELYEWQVDPGESADLVENPEYQSVLDGFRTYFEGLWAAVPSLSRLWLE